MTRRWAARLTGDAHTLHPLFPFLASVQFLPLSAARYFCIDAHPVNSSAKGLRESKWSLAEPSGQMIIMKSFRVDLFHYLSLSIQ